MAARPTMEELQLWELLTLAALEHATAVGAADELGLRLPSAERLIKARKAVRNRTLPIGQQFAASPMVKLLRLIDRWAVAPGVERAAKALELRDTAVEAAKLAGFGE